MRHSPNRAARRTAFSAAALLLAGCSTGHIGESWQCPLAEGGSCDSVAAADPAVPDTDTARRPALAAPLWQVRASEPEAHPAREPALPAREPAPDAIRGPGQAPETPCEAACGARLDPFGWLMGLFDGGDGKDVAASPDAAPSAMANSRPPVAAAVQRQGERDPAEESAGLPAEPGAAQDDAPQEDPATDDLRTGEVVARIWIAPFVDADGVYREESWVRVVLEPAGWRLR